MTNAMEHKAGTKTRHPAPPNPHQLSIYVEEAASALKLGEFQGTHCLSNSEASILLGRVQQERQNTASRAVPLLPVFTQTLRYTEKLAKFQHKDMTEHVRRVLYDASVGRKLEEFEMAQLANLCPETVDEAKALIPSLTSIEDEGLQSLLDQLNEARRYQT
jgi:DNA-directed RNA polymerase II subunit RPB4